MKYVDPITNKKFFPYCIEPSVGVGRLFLAVVCDSFYEETLEDNTTRNILKIHPYLSAYKVAVLPLTKKLSDKAEEVYVKLSKYFMVDYDQAGNIGKRYRRQDEIGTPMCVTVDFDTLEDGSVTVRDRDSMEQERIKIDDLVGYINKRIEF